MAVIVWAVLVTRSEADPENRTFAGLFIELPFLAFLALFWRGSQLEIVDTGGRSIGQLSELVAIRNKVELSPHIVAESYGVLTSFGDHQRLLKLSSKDDLKNLVTVAPCWKWLIFPCLNVYSKVEKIDKYYYCNFNLRKMPFYATCCLATKKLADVFSEHKEQEKLRLQKDQESTSVKSLRDLENNALFDQEVYRTLSKK
jgi:hypothetical protein